MVSARVLAMITTGALLLTTACSNDPQPRSAASGSSSSSTATTTSTTTTARTTIPDQADDGQQCRPTGTTSSPAVYDPAQGVYAVFITGIDVADRTLTYDVIQLLIGDDATRAYHRDHPEDPEGPPNDYYIVNESPRSYTSPVASNVRVRLTRFAQTGTPGLEPGSFDELPGYLDNPLYRDPNSDALSAFAYWLSIEGSKIVDICETWHP